MSPIPFILPAGTSVKHGTTSRSLRHILASGLVPGTGRHELREVSEDKPESADGIYVGDLMAHFGATAAFGAASHDLLTKVGLTLPIPEYVREEVVVPVVLHVELQADCELLADEDFVMFPEGTARSYSRELLAGAAEQVWTEYRSGAIVRSGGIPPDWILKFEFPLLWVPPRDQEPRGRKWKQLTSDAMVMAISHMQNWLKRKPEECWGDLKANSDFEGAHNGFSQSLPFTSDAIDRFFQFNIFRSAEEAFVFMGFLHQTFVELAAPMGGIRQ